MDTTPKTKDCKKCKELEGTIGLLAVFIKHDRYIFDKWHKFIKQVKQNALQDLENISKEIGMVVGENIVKKFGNDPESFQNFANDIIEDLNKIAERKK